MKIMAMIIRVNFTVAHAEASKGNRGLIFAGDKTIRNMLIFSIASRIAAMNGMKNR